MDVAYVRAQAAALRGHLSTLEHVAGQVSQTKRAALDPHAYGITSGEITIAPWSVSSVASASAELAAARAAIHDLLHRLDAEANAQVKASGNVASVKVLRTKIAATFSGAADSTDVTFTGDAGDPAVVAAWWASLTDAQREMLIESEPKLVGMLDGIPYTDRDKANQLALEQMRLDLIGLRDQYYATMAEYPVEVADAELAAAGYTIDQVLVGLDAVDAINETLAAGTDVRRRTLVQLSPGPPVTAAIAIGDMDTATQVTTLVPGMDATVADSMRAWTDAADNLYTEQMYINVHHGHESGLAVVSWIGYETPTPIDVLSSAKAEVGADNLVDFLEGISGTRGWNEGDNLSVVGHSYGTTTAMLAVSQTKVENLTLLASAGADSSITSVDDLQVPPGNIWASEAAGDGWADVGRWGPSAHPNNPTDSSFGAQVFSSEDASDGTLNYQGSDGHDAHLQVDATLAGKKSSSYGYLDQFTTPLHNTAVTSLGLGSTGLVGPYWMGGYAPGGGGGGGGGGR